ncbi:hypothetical protein QQZ08_008324 [Neonectria magnoliae]|uniref:DUF6604 domain-containing protein n=1 Tax=Neonectria magnoliae TaxID=2732573 RepID=A0ABR1HUV3_9HYPO
MLPSSLFSIYQQYKKDINSVASWLASTAKACGYPSDLLTHSGAQPTQPSGTGRLKGKARKDAKRQKPTGSVPQWIAPKYIIAIKEFVPLAEFIATSSKPLIAVPTSFVNTINRVIYVRSSFGSRMADHGMEPSPVPDATHSYFVGILEQVRTVLRPRMSAWIPAFDTVEELNTRFSGLDVFEPSAEFLDAPDIERPTSAQQDNTIYEAESPTSLEDAVLTLWAKYRVGSLDLVSVAVATNTGIDLARNLIDQVDQIFKHHGGASAVLEKFCIIYAMQEGFSSDDICSWGPDDGNEDVYELADKTYLNANQMLKALVKVLSPNGLPIYREGLFGIYDPQSDRASKKGLAKYSEDRIILAEFFTEAVTLARVVCDYPVEDEFIRGIRELDRTGNIPFYLIYATQILLDVHHTIRDKAHTALHILKDYTTTMDNML